MSTVFCESVHEHLIGRRLSRLSSTARASAAARENVRKVGTYEAREGRTDTAMAMLVLTPFLPLAEKKVRPKKRCKQPDKRRSLGGTHGPQNPMFALAAFERSRRWLLNSTTSP
jgi:hypothetical protein